MKACNLHKAQVPSPSRAVIATALNTISIPEARPHCLKFLVVFVFSKYHSCLLRPRHLWEIGSGRKVLLRLFGWRNQSKEQSK